MCGKNLDEQCPTLQSSTAYDANSSLANDGEVPLFGYTHTADTPGSTDPWWMIDFISPKAVLGGMIWGRRDCCLTRLDGFEVWIGNSSTYNGTGNTVCFVANTTEHDFSPYMHEFSCVGVARFLFVMLPGEGRILSLLEIEIYPPTSGK